MIKFKIIPTFTIDARAMLSEPFLPAPSHPLALVLSFSCRVLVAHVPHDIAEPVSSVDKIRTCTGQALDLVPLPLGYNALSRSPRIRTETGCALNALPLPLG